MWSDSDDDELEPGHSAGALGEEGVEAGLRGGSSAGSDSMRGSAGGMSAAVVTDTVERAKGLDGVQAQVRA